MKNINSQYRKCLLNYVRMGDLAILMNNKDTLGNYINEIENIIAKYELLSSGLRLLEEELKHPSKKDIDILSQYQCLTDNEKKQVSIDLYNDKNFQDNLWFIVLDGIKRNAPQILNFMKIFGIDFEKYMRETILSGRGYRTYIPDKEVAS